ncbi:MAG: hypothetical protein GY909_19185 [Oligoflexia bacterium]|nr:hypothetical protein [Oligoflexia bacterium]
MSFKSFKKKSLVCALSLMSLAVLAQPVTLTGVLSQNEDKFFLKNFSKVGPQNVEIKMHKDFIYTLDEKMVNSPNYMLQFEGDLEGNILSTEKTPTIVGGSVEVSGVFKEDNGNYFVGDQVASFGRTKPIYGIPFDNESKMSYVGKEVIAQGEYVEVNGEKVFSINAIVEKDIFKVESEVFKAPEAFDKDPKKFILEEMPKNVNSQSRVPFKGVMASKKGYTPEAGESVLVITVSGRQGDDPGASAGHFAIGGGVVNEEGMIDGETYNFYFEGPKEVLAGNTDLVSYFGHLIQGQQNYRPTYTLFAYGIDKKELRKVRDLYEKELHKVRTEKGLKITPGYNCTTTSNYVLRDIGIYGNNHNLGRRIFDVQNIGYINPFSWFANRANNESFAAKPRIISYVSTRDKEHYIPRPAFESYVKNFSSKRWRKRKGIKRVDFLFIPQTPSARQVGGISYNDPISEGNKIISFANKRDAERMKDIKRAQEILLNQDAADKADIDWAREYWAQDQAEVKELLNTID